MPLSDDIARAADRAAAYAAPGETLAGVLVAEPLAGRRVYLAAYAAGEESRTWLALDEGGAPIEDRMLVREAASISALCELAVETAAGGDLETLRAQLVALRLRERPPGIEEAEDAALALEHALGAPPRLASPRWLDEVGAATLRLEQALGEDDRGSPFAEAMKAATPLVEALAADVEQHYKRPLR